MTFRRREDFDAVLGRVRVRAAPFFEHPFVRFAGAPDEPVVFVVCDPSSNLVEFKHYRDPAKMY